MQGSVGFPDYSKGVIIPYDVNWTAPSNGYVVINHWHQSADTGYFSSTKINGQVIIRNATGTINTSHVFLQISAVFSFA